jgi:hypothetical protein
MHQQDRQPSELPSDLDERLRELEELADRGPMRPRRLPRWLADRDDDDGLRMLGHGLDDD